MKSTFDVIAEDIISRPSFNPHTDFPSAQLTREDMYRLTGAYLQDNPRKILQYLACCDMLPERVYRCFVFPYSGRAVAEQAMSGEIINFLLARCRDLVHDQFDEVLERVAKVDCITGKGIPGRAA